MDLYWPPEVPEEKVTGTTEEVTAWPGTGMTSQTESDDSQSSAVTTAWPGTGMTSQTESDDSQSSAVTSSGDTAVTLSAIAICLFLFLLLYLCSATYVLLHTEERQTKKTFEYFCALALSF